MSSASNESRTTSDHPQHERHFITVKEAAFLYSVSEDWLRRNRCIPKVTLGRRMVRIDVNALHAYFRQHEV
jgi:hypothetical protein